MIFWLLRVKDQDGFAFTSPSPAFTVEALSQGLALAGEGSEGKMQAYCVVTRARGQCCWVEEGGGIDKGISTHYLRDSFFYV